MTKPPPRVTPSFMPNERKFVSKDKIEAVDTTKLANKSKKRILEEGTYVDKPQSIFFPVCVAF